MIARVSPRILLGVILAVYLALATLYAVRVPPWNAPDEPAHYNFIRSIAVEHRLPILKPGDYNQAQLAHLMSAHFPLSDSIAGLRYESHQPPLYYLIAAPVYVATDHLGIRSQVVALRLVTSLIGALVILATYRLARLIFPRSNLYPLAAAAFVAFVPMHLFMDAAIDNDALAELMVTLTAIILAEDLNKRQAPRNDVRAGVVVGLAVLTKLVACISAVLVVIGFIGSAVLASDRRQAFREVPLRLVRAGVIAAVISGWWFVRNMIIYGLGDPFALRRHAQVVVGQPLTGHLTLHLIRQMFLTGFHSFWGQFGWMGIPYANRTYDVLATLSILVALGVVFFAWRVLKAPSIMGKGIEGAKGQLGFPSSAQRWILGLLVAEVALVFVGVIFYNVRYLQPQGRYIFPALPALAIFAVLGIGELFRAEYHRLVFMLAVLAMCWLCAWSLFSVIGPAFAVAAS